MNLEEYYLTKLGEECAEIAQMTSKSNCFGLGDVYDSVAKNPNKYNNRARLVEEINDLFAVIELMQDEGILPFNIRCPQMIREKKAKLAKYMSHSRDLGRLDCHPSIA